MVYPLFYDRIEYSLNLNTVEEVIALRPSCCLSPRVILLHLNPAIFRRYRAFNCVSVLFWFCLFCFCVCWCILSCADLWEWQRKMWDDPWLKRSLLRPPLWNSCLHWAWCCVLVFLASKQIRPRSKFHRQMFWVAGLSLRRSKTRKWGILTHLWLFP